MVRKKASESSTPARAKAVSKVPIKRAPRKVTRKPTFYNADMCDSVRELMAQGYSKEAVAGALRICKQSLYNWQEKHPAFAEAVKEGETLSLMYWENMGHKAMRGEVPGFNAAVWVFSMKNLHGWRDKQELSSDKDAPLIVNIIRHGQDTSD